MEEQFWRARWDAGQIGFHQSEVHEDLVREGARWLGEQPGAVLVPLCGKSLDLLWLAERAPVLGVELVEAAVAAFFAERGLSASRATTGAYTAWTAPELPRLTLLQGDIFALESLGERLSTITHVWDRAALVALPRDARAAYAANLSRLLPGARLLLNTFDIGPDEGHGPPFSVTSEEVATLYAGRPREERHRCLSEPSPAHKARGVQELLTLTWEIQL